MNEIRIVNDTYALTDGKGRVLGCIEKTGDENWGFYPIVEGTLSNSGTCRYVRLNHALEEALKFTQK